MKSFLKSKNSTLLAFQISWGIISLIILFVLFSPLILSESQLYSISSFCKSANHTGSKCVLCGATHSFVSITKGHFSEAINSNKISIYLYIIFLIDEILFLFFLYKFIKRNLLKIKNKSYANP